GWRHGDPHRYRRTSFARRTGVPAGRRTARRADFDRELQEDGDSADAGQIVTCRRPTAGGDPSRRIAHVPSIGPGARTRNAVRQPNAAASSGTIRMLAIVRRNPALTCSVSAVPTWVRGLFSAISAENCAESATALNPHTAPNTISPVSEA